MESPDALRGDQFREHLDEFHRQLGLEFDPHSVTLPGGARLPTAQQSVDVIGLRSGVERVLYAHVPSEAGNLHLLTAHIYGGHSNVQSNIAFDTGMHQTTGSAFWTPHRDQYPDYPEYSDPAAFQDRVRQIMSDAPSPSTGERASNTYLMQQWQEHAGLIHVKHEPVYNKGNRWYHFNVGTGRLTER